MITISSTYLLVNKVLLITIDAIGIWLALWVYFADTQGRVNRLFSLLTIFLLYWINGGYFFSVSKNLVNALYLGRSILGEVFLSLVIFYIFAVHFPRENKRHKMLEIVIILFGIVVFFLASFTNLVVENVEFTEWGVNPIYNSFGRIIFYGLVTLLAVLILREFFTKYFLLSKKEKLKVQYLLIGFFIFIFLNLVFNVFFPLVQGSIRYWQFGNYSAIFLLAFTAIAIVKQQLFGIRVVLTELLVGLIAILLLINFIISKSTFEYIWKGGLFVAFLVFGWLLVKSIIREIRQREQLDRLATQLAATNIRLEGAYKRLKKLDKAKSEFISIASHQLRTPLTAIKGYISMMLEGDYGKLSKGAVRAMENVYQSNERLIKLVNSLLNLSRIEAGRLKVEKMKTSIIALIEDLMEEFKPQAEKKNLYLKFEKPDIKVPSVNIDREKIRQALANLLDNAIKYTQKGGIKIGIKVENSYLRISISDTGEGMAKEELSKIFQSFSRAGAGRRLWTEGAGLGLYIAKRFIEMHKGRIWAESLGKGKGSTFFVELPIEDS